MVHGAGVWQRVVSVRAASPTTCALPRSLSALPCHNLSPPLYRVWALRAARALTLTRFLSGLTSSGSSVNGTVSLSSRGSWTQMMRCEQCSQVPTHAYTHTHAQTQPHPCACLQHTHSSTTLYPLGRVNAHKGDSESLHTNQVRTRWLCQITGGGSLMGLHPVCACCLKSWRR
jgi:hypothetical protein